MISLFAGHERSTKRDRLGDPLQVLDRAIDFQALAQAVDARLALERVCGAAVRRGRRS